MCSYGPSYSVTGVSGLGQRWAGELDNNKIVWTFLVSLLCHQNLNSCNKWIILLVLCCEWCFLVKFGMGMVIGTLVCDGVQESLYTIVLTSDCEVSKVYSDLVVRFF